MRPHHRENSWTPPSGLVVWRRVDGQAPAACRTKRKCLELEEYSEPFPFLVSQEKRRSKNLSPLPWERQVRAQSQEPFPGPSIWQSQRSLGGEDFQRLQVWALLLQGLKLLQAQHLRPQVPARHGKVPAPPPPVSSELALFPQEREVCSIWGPLCAGVQRCWQQTVQ